MFKLLNSYSSFFVFTFLLFSFCGNSEKLTNKAKYISAEENAVDMDNKKAESIQDTQEDYKLDIDPFDLPIISKAKGAHIKAISIAFNAFKMDSMIPEDKKNVENYDIELRQNKDNFFIYFAPYRTQEDRKILREGGESSLGKSVMFIIGKKDFEIKRRYFFM